MKNMKKVVAIVMAIMMLGTGLTGCGKKGGNKEVASNGGKEVQVTIWNSGWGTEFLEEMIKVFNAKQSEWFVRFDSAADGTGIRNSFLSEDDNPVDLYLSPVIYQTENMLALDDVLDSVADGDTKTLREKFSAYYLDNEKNADGHIYTLTWSGGLESIVYNKELFKKANITEVPRTTDELALVCDKLMTADVTPFIHHDSNGTGGYWADMQYVWFSQYEGVDYYRNRFFSCVDEQGKSPSKSVFTAKDGRYQVIKAMEKFLTPEYVYPGSNSQDHTTAQTTFLNSDIGMMVNGSWLANEMKEVGSFDSYGVMKTPVISAITDKLTTVKSDSLLRKLISAIDAVTDGTDDISEYQSGAGYVIDGKEVSAADWDYVKSARNSVVANYPQHNMFIPKYSDAIEGAKEFMKFFYSDEGYKIYTETLHTVLPMELSEGEISTEGWDGFATEMKNLYDTAENYVDCGAMYRHAIFNYGGASMYAAYNFIPLLCTNNPSDRVTADEAWEEVLKLIDQRYNSWVKNIE